MKKNKSSKKNKIPQCILDLKEQVNNSIELLNQYGLIRFSFPINESVSKNGNLMLTWDNHVGGRSVSSKAFLKIEQYISILESKAYHIILFDYSIIRVSFEFEGDKLISQNLLWWPCPVEITDFKDEDEESFETIVNLFLSDLENLRMRSPIRIDLDVSNDTALHPKAHMHTQHSDTRINTIEPICFNTFIKFVFNNFYPTVAFNNKQFPSRNLTFDRMAPVKYLNDCTIKIPKSYT